MSVSPIEKDHAPTKVGRLTRIGISGKLSLITLGSVVGFILISVLALYSLQTMLFEDRLVQVRNFAEAGRDVAQAMEERVKAGEVSEEEAQRQARNILKGMTFKESRYFFVITEDGVLLLSPGAPEYEGHNKLDLKDSNGVYLIRDLINCALKDGPPVRYQFPRAGSTQPVDKVAYALSFKPWGWVIGTGVYIDDIQTQFWHAAGRYALLALLIGLVIGTVSLLLARHIAQPLIHLSAVTKRLAQQDYFVEVEGSQRSDEIGVLGRSIEALRDAALLSQQRRQLEEEARRQVEHEIRILKKRYELILGSANDGILGLDAKGDITFANKAACQLLKCQPEEVVGWRCRDILQCVGESEFELPAFPLPPERIDSGEALFPRQGEEAFCAEYELSPIYEKAAFTGAALVFRDVSLRKRYEESIADRQHILEEKVVERTRTLSAEIKRRAITEQALIRSQTHLLSITANLFEGVLLVDVNGHILFVNRSAQRLLQTEDERLSGTEVDDVFGVMEQGEVRPFETSPFHLTIVRGEIIINDDAVFVTRKGTRLSVAYASAPMEERGECQAAVISFRSIEALKTAQREATQSSRLASVGQLAAGIAHEINTPIQYVGDNLRFISESLGQLDSIIKGVMGSITDTEPGSPLQERIERLSREHNLPYLLEELPLAASQSLEGVDHVSHIVRSMKEFSHPGSTQRSLTDVNRALNNTLLVTRNEWKHHATVETDFAEDLPQISCYPAELNQVWLNLIVNAAQAIKGLKSTEMGAVRLSTRCDGDMVEVRVYDSGPGVPKGIRDRIYDPFFTTKEVGQGTGQGLAICLDVIVNKHKGRLYLDDEVPSGACFVVRLPIRSEAEEPQPGDPDSGSGGAEDADDDAA